MAVQSIVNEAGKDSPYHAISPTGAQADALHKPLLSADGSPARQGALLGGVKSRVAFGLGMGLLALTCILVAAGAPGQGATTHFRGSQDEQPAGPPSDDRSSSSGDQKEKAAQAAQEKEDAKAAEEKAEQEQAAEEKAEAKKAAEEKVEADKAAEEKAEAKRVAEAKAAKKAEAKAKEDGVMRAELKQAEAILDGSAARKDAERLAQQRAERASGQAFEAEMTKAGFSCKARTCAAGNCDQAHCAWPTCDGGHCLQRNAYEPSCSAGGCDQADSVRPRCSGGGCTGAAH